MRDGVYRPLAGWRPLLLRVILAVGAMIAVLVAFAGPVAAWGELGWTDKVPRLAALIGGAGATYFAVLFVSGLRPRHVIAP